MTQGVSAQTARHHALTLPGDPPTLPRRMLLFLATMCAITLLYWRELRWNVMAAFWGAYAVGYGILALPWSGAGFTAITWMGLVAVGFAIKAKMSA
jgi:hypothetical protein